MFNVFWLMWLSDWFNLFIFLINFNPDDSNILHASNKFPYHLYLCLPDACMQKVLHLQMCIFFPHAIFWLQQILNSNTFCLLIIQSIIFSFWFITNGGLFCSPLGTGHSIESWSKSGLIRTAFRIWLVRILINYPTVYSCN